MPLLPEPVWFRENWGPQMEQPTVLESMELEVIRLAAVISDRAQAVFTPASATALSLMAIDLGQNLKVMADYLASFG